MTAPRIAVVFHSSAGHVEQLADAIAEGAQDAGADVRVRRVQDPEPGPGARRELARIEDLEWADGLALGSPTRFGTMAAPLAQFLGAAESAWRENRLADKFATSFTSAENVHGGMESTLLSINNVFYHWGCLIVPPGYTDPCVFAAGGNPYGAAFASGGEPGAVSAEALGAAQHQGHRLASFAGLIAARR